MTTEQMEEDIVTALLDAQNALTHTLSFRRREERRTGRELPPDAKVLNDAQDLLDMIMELKNDLLRKKAGRKGLEMIQKMNERHTFNEVLQVGQEIAQIDDDNDFFAELGRL